MSKFDNLITQIELFIRKYYKNEMLKGGILFVSFALFSFLFINVLEYFGRFNQTARFVMFYSFIGVNLILLVKFILIPLLKLNKLSNRLSLTQASKMIGHIFPSISDKLHNTLQLNAQLTANNQNISLIQASIEQRASNLSAIPFATGIELKENRKYLKFLWPILMIVLAVGFFKPSVLDSSNRIVNYNTEFIPAAPFEFNLMSEKAIKEGSDYTLIIKLTGDEIPQEVAVKSNVGTYNLKKKSSIVFEYTFLNVKENLKFTCEANGYSSEKFEIVVLKKPTLDDISLTLNYPKHTGMANETLNNIGDVTIPEGTQVEWNLKGHNIKNLTVLFKDTSLFLNPDLSNKFKFNRPLYESINYGLVLSSPDIEAADTFNYNINVVKDEYPTISVNDVADSLNHLNHLIDGTISDDYGFRSLVVSTKIIRKDSTQKSVKSIGVSKQSSKQFFFYQLDYGQFNLKPGDKLEYTFTVTDNDYINNFKFTSSIKKIYAVPTIDSLENLISENNSKVESEMDQAKDKANDIKQNIKDIKNDLINKKSPDWKDKQNLENLLEMQQNLQKQIDELKNKYEENKQNEDQFLDNSEELKQKQEELQKLLDELMDDELKELMEELQKLMDDMNKDNLIENLEQMEMNQEALEEELDRALELFKNLELDEKLESIQEQLNELSKEQKDLEKLTEDKALSDEELAKKQEEINKKFDEIQKDIEDAKQKNDELETPRNLDFNQELEDQIENELNESKENLDNGKTKKSEKNQGKAAEMMEQMANEVAAMQSQAQQEQASEDMDALRFLMENLIALSHQQEDLMLEYDQTKTNDPKYLTLNRTQLQIDQATEIVNDSLIALSKRVFQLESFINDELSDLNYSLEQALVYSEERKTNQLMQNQQYAITSYNNLALMLSEVLDQMQQQQKNSQPGQGSCNKPGGQGSGQPKSSQMTMEQMKQQMKDQIAKMKNGSKPGGKEGDKDGKGGQGGQKPGGQQGNSIPGLSQEEIAKMAFKQGQMRKSLEKMRQELNKDGSGNGNQLNELIKDIEQLENDLLNGNYTNDLLKRQQEIYTRLLESEKALMERGYSEKRESKSGKNENDGNQIDLSEYNKKKQAEIELLKSVPLGLRVYYKNLINEYFNSVNH
ncbi:MAG: hypothetical protein ACWA41_03465 [Putridiphycobacter sp.]